MSEQKFEAADNFEAKSVITRQELVGIVADAIESADVGYKLCLTRLVDGVSTFTLTYYDGSEPLEFDDIDDGYEHIAKRRAEARANAAIDAILATLSGQALEMDKTAEG